MTGSQIVNIVLGILAVIATFVSYYFYIQGKVIKAAQEAVNDVEPDVGRGGGEEKLKNAVEQVYSLIPAILKPVLTREIITGIVQAAFDKIEAYAKKQVKNKTEKITMQTVKDTDK